MSCCGSCGQEIVVNVPGSAGASGAAGTNGQNAFTLLTGALTIPAANANVTAAVASSLWMAVGQILIVSDGTNIGNFQVVSFPSVAGVVLKWLNYTGDSVTTTVIASGATVSPAGLAGVAANTFANGGTTGTTKATAQTNLGLGQDAVISSGAALAQAVTASFVQVGSVAVVIPALGSWLYMANVSVDFAGTTFASSRTITAKLRNTTQGVDLAQTVLKTEVQTTQNLPTAVMEIPFKLDATAAVSDVLQIWISIDVINSAGTLSCAAGNICAIPLRKS